MSPARRPLILVLNGPNLNLLGTRQPEIYGKTTLAQIRKMLEKRAGELGVDIEFLQSNSEGELIDTLHAARGRVSAAVLNPAAYTHYSYALRDAVEAAELPVVEVHLSNIYAREPFRRHSVLSEVCVGVVCGLGADGYVAALDAAVRAQRKAKGKR